MRSLIQNGRIITPTDIVEGSIVIEDGIIVDVREDTLSNERDFDNIFDASGRYVAPGFIDLHTHGGGGHDFMDGSVEAFVEGARSHLPFGTTTLLPTTLASLPKELFAAISAFQQAQTTSQCPHMPGLHIEGPYLSMEQRGAQDPKYIKDPDPEEYQKITTTGAVARWTIAPELPGALDMARYLTQSGIVCSIGHSNAHYDQVVAAFAAGFNLCTHLYSGMSIVHRINAHRYAGVVESAFLLDDMYVELIADGVHLPASLLKLVYKVKGPDRICLVTDSIRGMGMTTGMTLMGSKRHGQEVLIEEGVAKLPDRTAFAGSVCTADRLIRTMVQEAGVPLHQAVRMLTTVPAQIMGWHHKGQIAVGKDADIVLFDDQILVSRVFLRGEIVQSRND